MSPNLFAHISNTILAFLKCRLLFPVIYACILPNAAVSCYTNTRKCF